MCGCYAYFYTMSRRNEKWNRMWKPLWQYLMGFLMTLAGAVSAHLTVKYINEMLLSTCSCLNAIS